MDFSKDYYSLLKVAPNADPREIKRSFRKLAMKLHPDVTKEDKKSAEEQFKAVSEAYEVLSDIDKRREYDAKFLGSQTRRQTSHYGHRGVDKNVAHPGQRPKDGRNRSRTMTISREEWLMGTTKTIGVTKSSLCPVCQGTAKTKHFVCSRCGGKGVLSVKQRLEVKVSPRSSRLRIKNYGSVSFEGGRSGDLFLKIVVKDESTNQSAGYEHYNQTKTNTFRWPSEDIYNPTRQGNRNTWSKFEPKFLGEIS